MKKNAYLHLWLLLSVGIAVIMLIAFTDEIKIGSYTMKKAPIAEIFEAKQNPDTVALTEVRAAADSVKNDNVETDTTQQTLLLFGDSMVYNMSFQLARYAKHNGHKLYCVNWDSSHTKLWASNDSLARYIRRYKPTQIFITLGTNELLYKNPETRLPHIKKILEVIDTIPYVWIGPPNWTEDFGINDLIEKTCRKGSFFRSKGMEFEREKDGYHPTKKASDLWIDSIMRWIPKSAHPFRADLPPDSVKYGHINLVYFKSGHK